MTYSNQEIYGMFQEGECAIIEQGSWIDVIEQGSWIDGGKRSYRTSVVKIYAKFYEIKECRWGSYYTDYDYEDPEIYEVTPKEVVITKTVYERIK